MANMTLKGGKCYIANAFPAIQSSYEGAFCRQNRKDVAGELKSTFRGWGLTLLRMTSELCLRYRTLEKGLYFMKQIEEKFKRKVKYWLITYKQASGRDRLHLGLYSVLILVYMWWYFLIA